MPNKMFVWEVELEERYEVFSTETGKLLRPSSKDTGITKFTVAASSGFGAIERAKKLALDKDNIFIDDFSTEDEKFVSTPVRVVDVTSLELKETLDG